jgi:hypothetical protein
MGVVPVWKLEELLDDEELVDVRKKAEESQKEKDAQEPHAVLDVAPGTDEFSGFEDLTRKLVNVPKTEIDEKRGEKA